jgi:hypothetical protein
MRPGDAFDDEMRRHPRNAVPPLDPTMVERLLDGTVHEDDVPPDYRDVLRVLSAAAAPAPAVPSAEAAALAAFRSARRPVDPPRRTSVLSKLLGAKAIAALVLGTATVGTAAAATGTLPDAAQAKAHSIVAAVPDADPGGHAAGAAKAAGASDTARAGGGSAHATLPGAAGLCQAYASGSGGENGRRLDSTAFQRLADAAGGADKIAAYCGTATAAASRAAGSAATGDRKALAGACRAWLAADRAGRAPAAAVLDRLTTAAGGAGAIAPYCAALVGEDNGGGAAPSDRPSADPSAPPATPRGNAPTAPPGNGHGTPSHPAPPTPRA